MQRITFAASKNWEKPLKVSDVRPLPCVAEKELAVRKHKNGVTGWPGQSRYIPIFVLRWIRWIEELVRSAKYRGDE